MEKRVKAAAGNGSAEDFIGLPARRAPPFPPIDAATKATSPGERTSSHRLPRRPARSLTGLRVRSLPARQSLPGAATPPWKAPLPRRPSGPLPAPRGRVLCGGSAELATRARDCRGPRSAAQERLPRSPRRHNTQPPFAHAP